MSRFPMAALLAAAGLSLAAPAESQAPVQRQGEPTYADLADLAVGAPVAAHVRIRRATPLDRERAPGLAPGKSRFYVEADVVSLIRGAAGLPPQVRYLADLPNDGRGKPVKLRKKSDQLILAHPVPGRAGELRLAAPDAQLPFTPARADMLRAILTEAVAPDAAPAITGIGKAFNVPGTLPGESETQIFLLTADNRPVSLNVLRRPGETPRWAVALTEIVDDSAAPPRPNSLLWYRLACTLPRTLPRQSLADADIEQMTAIQADYRLVLDRLGPCLRSRSAS